ncbi:aldehyde dehydrogenase family protein [Salegentibacter sp. F188]|jgi:acyl-CoA reductase-like NAD-dependent aldehyde dehydrogenase|uniref:Aldehyde dehydrogenase family protein n=1 Tax=Autumnicola patrickiae TaxID=3075591 RepID=A0ABU3E5Z3_9FLAO|nr:aldehyde dehydrogenase family protein [Salegentibacter sp. F188]MDT0691345.1 aldehyde dehydrogenase family protein [Salegentibacter sp. F188]
MLKIISPYDQKVIKEIRRDGKEAAETALSTAYDLFQNRKSWLEPHERITILSKVAALMENRRDELTQTATREGGKPLIDSKIEVLRAINGVRLAVENIGHVKGGQIPMGLTAASENRMAFTTREPIGVVLAISAFNHPLNLIVHQVVTAVAVGCPVIVKPAQNTPLSCLAFVDLLEEAGLPDGWCQAIICDNEVAESMVIDKRVNFFSFIGSAKVGWYLKSKLPPGTRCVLEHGGAAPVIVEKDADMHQLIPALVKGGFYHAGQVCVSVQRVFVEESISEEVVGKMAEDAKKLIVGDPMDEKTEVGPLISPFEVDRVEQWVKEAVQGGAGLICGGKRISDTCYEPTVLLNPPLNAKVSTREIFGPVVCVYTYSNRDKAIEIANDLEMHFQAAVFTKNLDIAFDCINKLNATAVMVNDHTAFRVDWMPFGGRDASGIGMGGIKYAMHEMTRVKLMVFKSNVL